MILIYPIGVGGAIVKKKFDVIGMTCSACSAHVDKAVRGLEGVEDVNVNLLSNCMTVEYDENVLTDHQIMDAVDKSGYKAQLENQVVEKNEKKQEENDIKKKSLIYSIIFLIPLFIYVWDICLVFPCQLFCLDMKI